MSVENATERPLVFGSPRFRVAVGDQTFVDRDGIVTDLVVETTLDGADRFDVTLVDVYDGTTGVFDQFDWDAISVGEPVEIAVGYDHSLTTVLTGRVQTVSTSFPADSGPRVTVGGYDRLVDLMHGERSRAWSERTDSDVVRDVLSEYSSLSLEAEETGLTHPTVIQDATNDYRFLRDRAARNGFELFAREAVVSFRPPAIREEPRLSLQYGRSFRSFDATVNETGQASEVVVRHWDPITESEIIGTATRETDVGIGTEILRHPVRSTEEAVRLAEAAMDRIIAGRVLGRGETVGTPEIRTGESVELSGIGPFEGTYYVESVTHRIDTNGYRTEFEATERVS